MSQGVTLFHLPYCVSLARFVTFHRTSYFPGTLSRGAVSCIMPTRDCLIQSNNIYLGIGAIRSSPSAIFGERGAGTDPFKMQSSLTSGSICLTLRSEACSSRTLLYLSVQNSLGVSSLSIQKGI